jgi:hypothetical protein
MGKIEEDEEEEEQEEDEEKVWKPETNEEVSLLDNPHKVESP